MTAKKSTLEIQKKLSSLGKQNKLKGLGFKSGLAKCDKGVSCKCDKGAYSVGNVKKLIK